MHCVLSVDGILFFSSEMTATRLQHKDRRAGRVFVRKKTATRLQHRYRRVVCSSHILSPFIFFPFLKRDCALRHAHGCGVLPLIATWQCVFIRLAISLQYTARCNMLQHTATHCNTLHWASPEIATCQSVCLRLVMNFHCNTLQTTTVCKILSLWLNNDRALPVIVNCK